MRNILSLILSLFILNSCSNNQIEGTYSSNEGPYFKFNSNNTFEFGIPGDKNPLRGSFTQNGNKIDLVANAVILGNYATTNFICNLMEDTLTIDLLHITHPRFEVFIDKLKNYGRAVRDKDTSEYKLNTPEAEREFFIYYKLVYDKFIKKNGG
ncbi:MAG: hypothetical protein N3F03_08540 [Ignavibacteria bacterium]|nr:hypothetical protein [Ignavibacteria bacterium]